MYRNLYSWCCSRSLCLCLLSLLWPASVFAQAPQVPGWHQLSVPGGRATLRALGVDDSRERAAVMIELIRRLHFSTTAPIELEAAIRALPAAPLATAGTPLVTLPLPMAHSAWERVIGRSLPPQTMFRAILADVPARLLFHGLAGLDSDTRQWFERESDLLRAIYRNPDAVKAFAMFAPAIEVARGRVLVPGGDLAEARWSRAIGAFATDPRRFVTQLFLERAGRAAGLYFLTAWVEPPRRQFLLHAADAAGPERFVRLVDAFAGCYSRDSNGYPFGLRSNDPALLLLATGLSGDGQPNGPRSSSFWERVFEGSELTASPVAPGGRVIDAAWLVERLCSSPTRDRPGVFSTLLAGQRVFALRSPGEAGGEATPASESADAVVALRVRRLFPSVFIALERAGVNSAATFAVVGRHALLLDRLNDTDTTPVVLQQFQGALAMALRAAASGTMTQRELARVLTRLTQVRLDSGRYDGRLAAWFERELLPAIGYADGHVVEYTVAGALAGPPASRAVRVTWEGLEYFVDYPRSMRDRLMAVRAKQGGATLDRALELSRTARGSEAVQAADAMLAQVLASWAYAPHVGDADSGALVGGDGSRRHDLGLRGVNRTRFEQRWTVAVAPGDRGVIAGSYLGLEAGLANWSLRRLSADVIPPEPTLGDNDRMSLLAMVSLSESSRLSDADLHRIAEAIEDGQQQVLAAGRDATRLDVMARTAAISPWRRAALHWMAFEEPARIPEQFSLSARAKIGGLSPSQIPAWGTSKIPLGCLCLGAPLEGVPELIVGRPVDGIVGTQSADLQLRVAQLLTQLEMPAQLTTAVLAYAMRDYIDRLRPAHPADTDAFARVAPSLTLTMVEDYIGAIAAIGPLRPVQ